MLFHGPSSTLLYQPATLELVGTNCLHLEADELPTIQNGTAKGAKRHLVDLCGPAGSPSSMLYLVLSGYQGIFGSQSVSSLSVAILIESFQNHKTQARQIENDVSHIKYHLNYRDEVHTFLR